MKAVVLYSGGMDSTVLLYHAIATFGSDNVAAVSIEYGQRHVKEVEVAERICGVENVLHRRVVLDDVAAFLKTAGDAALVNADVPVPEGHYAEESMKATIVPNRNMMMVSIAVAYALVVNADRVYFAAHAGDHAIYPDCRPEFVNAMNTATQIGNEWNPVTVHAPFVNLTKAEIARLGKALRAPLYATWSCYKGGDKQCGRCGTCVERKEAFALAGVPDATDYEEETA